MTVATKHLARRPRPFSRMLDGLASAGAYIAIAAAVLAVLLPLLYVIRIALVPVVGIGGSQTSLPPEIGLGAGFTIDNFVRAWVEQNLGQGFLNSLLVVPLGAAISTAAAVAAGFALAKLAMPGRPALFALIIVTLGIPIPAIVIPLLIQGLSLGYANNLLGLAICYGAVFSVFGAIYVRYVFLDFPDEVIEAARLDGCTTVQLFFRIVVPMSGSAIAPVFVLNLLYMWGELLLGLVLVPGSGKQTLPVVIATFLTTSGIGGPLTAAAAILVAIPVVVIVLVGNRFLRVGDRAGAVKG